MISIPLWILIGGLVVFNVCYALYNIVNLDNDLSFTPNFGLIVGIVLKLFWGIAL